LGGHLFREGSHALRARGKFVVGSPGKSTGHARQKVARFCEKSHALPVRARLARTCAHR
jgi:hypothetical protein